MKVLQYLQYHELGFKKMMYDVIKNSIAANTNR